VDLDKIARNDVPLSGFEQEVAERLNVDPEAAMWVRLALEEGLQQLTEKQRTCFQLWADGHTLREIATALRLSLPTVQQHLTAARQKLQRLLRESGESV